MNKKILLGLLALAATYQPATAQRAWRGPAVKRGQMARPTAVDLRAIDNALPGRPALPSVQRPATAPLFGRQVGITWYDLLSNNASYDRIKRGDDGSISIAFTQSCTDGSAGGAYPNRGAGYNYSPAGGTNWLYPNAQGNCGTTGQYGVSSRRTGFTEMALVDRPGGGQDEIIFAHSGTGMTASRRQKGTGTWSAANNLPFTTAINGVATATATWVRVATSGQTVHMVYASGEQTSPDPVSGVISPMFYSRSLDGGVTWDKQNIVLPGIIAADFERIGGDDYSIAANGQNVSIIAGTFFESVKVWMSSDNGDTFVVKDVYKNFARLTTQDVFTIQTTTGADTVALRADNNFDIVVDNGGKTHVFFGLLAQGVADTLRTGVSYDYSNGSTYDLGLGYWGGTAASTNVNVTSIADVDPYQDSNAPFTGVATSSDAAPNDVAPYRFPTGYESMATAATDAAGNVYVIYAGVVQGASNTGTDTGQPFRDLYVMVGRPGVDSVSWSTPLNISRDIYNVADGGSALNLVESAYPSMDPKVAADGILHFIWMSDDEPGNNLNANSTDPARENAICYSSVTKSRVLGVSAQAAAYVNAVSTAPNPTTGLTALHVDMKQAATASVVVRNVLGREVARVPATALSRGANTLRLDLSNLASGVYFYTVSGANFSLTQRVVKN